MRIRTAAAGAAIAFVALFGWVSPARAGEAPTGEGTLSTETQECIEHAEAANDPDACIEAPSPILPPTNELIWGAISFTLLFVVLAKFAYPAIKKSMNDRTDRIRGDLEAAEAAKADAQTVLEQYRAQLADAKAESGRIIEEARQQADTLRKDLEAKAQTDAQGIRDRAATDAQGAKAQAMADLRNEIAQLVSEGVDAVVTGGIDEAAKGRLVDQYISSLSSRSN